MKMTAASIHDASAERPRVYTDHPYCNINSEESACPSWLIFCGVYRATIKKKTKKKVTELVDTLPARIDQCC
jgi:hypothetical protein